LYRRQSERSASCTSHVEARTDRAAGPAPEERQLPALARDVVAKNADVALLVVHLEVAMIGSQPAVDHLCDVDLGAREPESSRRLLASGAGVALDLHDERQHRSLWRHLANHTPSRPRPGWTGSGLIPAITRRDGRRDGIGAPYAFPRRRDRSTRRAGRPCCSASPDR